MSTLTRFFFRAPYAAPSSWEIIAWWEARRPAYNLAVGTAGLVSLAAMTLAQILPPHGRAPMIPWLGVVVYGMLANLCYCAGPALDLMICRRWGSAFASIGPALFRYGFAFAVGLTLLPVPVAVMGWLVRALGIN